MLTEDPVGGKLQMQANDCQGAGVAFTTVDGARLWWEAGGHGDPLLLIQGLGFSGAMWYRLLPALEPHYRVIRYDARGIGRSDVPPGPYPIERMAADAVAVLDAAGEATAHVFGCSLGGIVAQEVALGHPDRVRSLTLCCTHPAGTDAVWPDASVMQMLQERASLPLEEAVRASVDVGYAPTTDRVAIEEDIKLRLEIPTSAEGYRNQLYGGLGYPGTGPRLPGVGVPTLVIAGDRDRMVPPANAEFLARTIPGARLVVVPGAGHVIFTDQPQAVTDAMLEFLGEVSVVDEPAR
jgi:pimeloyl-ACP methyl ester carboxylesterase